jgi:RNA polymerase sigma-70 factor (ECF subfamily)
LFLGNEADAEDATGEVFLQVVRKLPTFRGESAFSTWLIRVAIHAILDFRRRRGLRRRETCQPLEGIPLVGRLPSAQPYASEPLDALIAREMHEHIEQAIAALPELYRNVLVLADLEDRPNKEIASLLGLSLPAVKSRLHRGRMLLRSTLSPWFEDSPPQASRSVRPRHQEEASRPPCCSLPDQYHL